MICRISKVLMCLVISFTLIVILGMQQMVQVKAEGNQDFANGADIGWLKQLEDEGVTWLNDEGVQQDALQILKDHGLNAVRLRVFVNPNSNYYTNPNAPTGGMLGYADKAGVLAAAIRARDLDMDIMLDFHLSDTWADPGHQNKPKQWEGYSVTQIKDAVYDHVYDVVSALVQENAAPKWVQIGNEVTPGMILPEGSIYTNVGNLVLFSNAGYDAVKAASSTSRVITHMAGGGDNSKCVWWLDRFFNAGGKTDIIGLSYYPHWAGEPQSTLVVKLKNNMNDLISRYDKDIMVVETGGKQHEPQETYLTIKGAINAVKALPNNRGLGVFYWEPEANSSVLPDQYILGATTEISTKVLQFTTAIDAFIDGGNTPTNLLANANFETGDLTGWTTWTNGNADATYVESGGYDNTFRNTHWKETAYKASTYQYFHNIENGTYKMTAWVKNGGGQTTCQIFAKFYGSEEVNTALPVTDEWTLITIDEINVTNNSCMLGFWSVANPGNWASIDNVTFTKID